MPKPEFVEDQNEQRKKMKEERDALRATVTSQGYKLIREEYRKHADRLFEQASKATDPYMLAKTMGMVVMARDFADFAHNRIRELTQMLGDEALASPSLNK